MHQKDANNTDDLTGACMRCISLILTILISISLWGRESALPKGKTITGPDLRYWTNDFNYNIPVKKFYRPNNSPGTEYPCLTYNEHDQEWYLGTIELTQTPDQESIYAPRLDCLYFRPTEITTTSWLFGTIETKEVKWKIAENSNRERIYLLKAEGLSSIDQSSLYGFEVPYAFFTGSYLPLTKENDALCFSSSLDELGDRQGKYEYGIVQPYYVTGSPCKIRGNNIYQFQIVTQAASEDEL